MRSLIEDVDLLKPVALSHGEVVRIVRRRHLHEAGAEIGVDVEIREDGNLAVHDGQNDRRTHELVLLMVFGRNRHARVAEHGFGTRGGHHDVVLPVNRLGKRIAQMPQAPVFLLVFRLVVGDGGSAGGAPVHDALAAIDKSVVVPVAKHLAHGTRIVGVHGEVLIGKVDRTAHALYLLDDVSTVLVRPVPARLEELLASYLAARDAHRGKLFVHLGLRGDTRMVGAEHPAGGNAAHAVHADDGVLDGVVHGMPHMQNARDVRRRNGDGAVAHTRVALVIVARKPLVEHTLLDGIRIVDLRHVFHRFCFSFKTPL